MHNLFRNLRRSLTILLEGVLIAIGAIIIVVFLVPFGAAGLIRWTWDRLVDAWTNKQ